MSKIGITFGTPEHGWLPVTLSCDEQVRVLLVSHVPADSLHMLAVATLNVIEGRTDGTTVTWFLEPEHERWRLSRMGQDYELSVRPPGRGTNFSRFACGTIDEICAPIWRGFCRLKASPVWSALAADRVWLHSFPSKEVAQLGVRLGRRTK